MFSITLDTSPLTDATRRLADAVDDELSDCVARSAQGVARNARAQHEFRNQSGDLERSIEVLETGGKFTGDTLHSHVIAGMDYAQYVERKLPFLQPAWDAIDPVVSQDAEYGLEAACRKAGWT